MRWRLGLFGLNRLRFGKRVKQPTPARVQAEASGGGEKGGVSHRNVRLMLQ